MQLTTLKCPACGAVANIQGKETLFTCDYCQNKVAIIKPLSIDGVVDGLNEIEQTKYSNYLSILNQAMLAGNYKEGYEYCNKALEINPKSASIWENKAICTFWVSTVANLEEKTGEIISYLNASRQIDANSKTYDETASSIADNLYEIARYKYNNVSKVRLANNSYGYDFNGENDFISIFRLFDMCFQIYPKVEYLEKSLQILTSGGMWVVGNNNSYISNRHKFDAVKKVQILRNKIKEIRYKNPEYRKADEKRIKEMKIRNENNKIIIKWVIIFGAIFLVISFITALFVKSTFEFKKNEFESIFYLICIAGLGVGAIIGAVFGNIKVKKFRKTENSRILIK